jgi:hypothetical protein
MVCLRKCFGKNIKRTCFHWVLVAHACNPSYSRGRDQEECGLTPAAATSLRDPILKNPSHKRAGGVAQGAGLEFKRQHCQKKRKHVFHCLIEYISLFLMASTVLS